MASALAALACGDAKEMSSSAQANLDAAIDVGLALEAGDVPVEDGDKPTSLVVLPAEFTEENAPLRMLRSGDPIGLWRAPQGGHVVLIGAQVKNMATKAAALRVRMRRLDTGFIVAQESRTVAMVPVDGEPGTMQPDIRSRSQVAHVPLCPDYDPVDIVDRPLEVEIHVTALYTDPPLSGTATLRLTPSCGHSGAEPEMLCRCECSGGYVLGKCGSSGGRTADGGDGG